jgi:hypothetical protein
VLLPARHSALSALSTPGAAMYFSTIVRVVDADQPDRGIVGVKVALFDADLLFRDDHLGAGSTSENGEVRFEYSSEQFVDFNDRFGGEMPELYAVVYDADDKEVFSTRTELMENQARKQITVCVPHDLLQRHGLLPAG